MSSELILFSTEHCTLCDEALDLLLSMPELAGRSVQVVDVAANPELVDRYGESLEDLFRAAVITFLVPAEWEKTGTTPPNQS